MAKESIIHRQVRLTTTGSAGSAVATATLGFPQLTGRKMSQDGLGYAGILRAVSVDYHASAPATTDVTIKADDSSGSTLLTIADNATDIGIKALGHPGKDEANGALAATDGSSGGAPFYTGLYFDVAESDALTDAVVVDVFVEIVRLLTVELRPVGADGSAVVVRTVPLPFAGCIRYLKVDYQNQPVTTDLIIKANDSAGATLFTAANTATDIAAPVGTAAIDEGNAATAATDATDGGLFFSRGLYFDVAQGDGQTGGDERIIVDCFIDA